MIQLLRSATQRLVLYDTHILLEEARPHTPQRIAALVELIAVPPVVRMLLEDFCAAHPGPDAEEILETLRMRDAMLDYLDHLGVTSRAA